MSALSIRQLVKTYPNGVHALNGIDLDVAAGDFFALLGPNGAGKTTLIGIVTSLVNKTSGTVSVFGYDIDRQLEAAKACIGIVPQEVNFNLFETCETILVNQAGFYGIPRREARRRAAHYLELLQLADKRKSMARGLSGGMKRRLMIARALMHEPELLILDEPTSAMASWAENDWMNRFRSLVEGRTALIITHRFTTAMQADVIHVIHEGEIVESGSHAELVAHGGRYARSWRQQMREVGAATAVL